MSLGASVIIPVFNEEDSIGRVLDALPQEKLNEIILSEGEAQESIMS